MTTVRELARDPVIRRAIADATPLAVPAVPFALVVGLAMSESAMPTAVAWTSNIIVFAGAAQLVLVSLAATSTWLTLVAAAVVLNLRHVMYSAALSPRFSDQPRWFRYLAPTVLIDQLFALVVARPELTGRNFRRAYLATGAFFFTVWNVAVVIGVFVGDFIPTSWRIDVAPGIMFLGIVVLGIANRAGLAAAIVGGSVSAITLDLPNNLGLLLGAFAGVTAGYLLDRQPLVREAVDQ